MADTLFTFFGEKLDSAAAAQQLDAFLDTHNRILNMQVFGARFENTASGIVIAIDPVKATGGGSNPIWVRLTAFNSGTNRYTGVKIEPDGAGSWQDVSPTVTYTTIYEQHNFIGIELGARVEIQTHGTVDGSTTAYRFHFVRPRETFDVTVVQTGGSNGNATTQASWTYRVDNADGHVLATGKSPVFTGFRLSAGPVTAGTRGIASYDDAGVLSLLTVNEVHGKVVCS